MVQKMAKTLLIPVFYGLTYASVILSHISNHFVKVTNWMKNLSRAFKKNALTLGVRMGRLRLRKWMYLPLACRSGVKSEVLRVECFAVL